jgi:hypothetical protein
LLAGGPLRDIAEPDKPGKQSKAARQMTLDLPEAEHCGVRYEYPSPRFLGDLRRPLPDAVHGFNLAGTGREVA